MRSRLPAALGAALVLIAGTAAQAQEWHPHHRGRMLPPVSGTLRMEADDFGHARPSRALRRSPRPEIVQVVRGGLYPQETDYYPRETGYSATASAERWATGGTGVSGIVGNTGNPYFGQTGWGTADSATTGSGFATRPGWQRRGLFTQEPSLAERYGEAPIYPGVGYGGAAYGATPQLPFYGSGAPYSMAYYGSGSSAGPDGSPGGLGTYRSGSYDYGPRVVETGAYAGGGADGGYRQGCTCGPRIVHVRRHHRYYSER